jgi:hypothetical protein
MLEAGRHPYLENDRHLPAALLELMRFAGRIKIDAKGNAVFPHFDQQGLCGYKIKNRGFTGFARGGATGLWSSHEELGCLIGHCVDSGGPRPLIQSARLNIFRHCRRKFVWNPPFYQLLPDVRRRYGQR